MAPRPRYSMRPDFDNCLEPANFPDLTGAGWKSIRCLGRGGFGEVTLWVKADEEGNITEEMALKSVDYDYRHDYSRANPGVLSEAVIHALLNKSRCDSILHLMAYKFCPADGRCRFYLEYCPHGDLHSLLHRYIRAGQYLPEPFLWHVFHGLAKAAKVMANTRDSFNTAEDCVVHFDIKHENIFVSRKTVNSGGHGRNVDTLQYEPIKLCDFGLAAIIGPHHSDNPRKYWGTGTRGCRAPVGFSPIFSELSIMLIAFSIGKRAFWSQLGTPAARKLSSS